MKIEQKEKEFRRIILRRRDRLALLSHENITPSTLISFYWCPLKIQAQFRNASFVGQPTY